MSSGKQKHGFKMILMQLFGPKHRKRLLITAQARTAGGDPGYAATTAAASLSVRTDGTDVEVPGTDYPKTSRSFEAETHLHVGSISTCACKNHEHLYLAPGD